jgi:hypothetical protein
MPHTMGHLNLLVRRTPDIRLMRYDLESGPNLSLYPDHNQPNSRSYLAAEYRGSSVRAWKKGLTPFLGA